MKGPHFFEKRKKEMARQEKAKQKAERKAQRKAGRDRGPSDEPDDPIESDPLGAGAKGSPSPPDAGKAVGGGGAEKSDPEA
jgi:hypothetical protein